MNPKPKPGAYRRKRKREREAQAFAERYGSQLYVERVTSHPCVVRSRSPSSKRTDCVMLRGRAEAAHVEKKTRPGVSWRDLVPLCTQHHAEQEGDTQAFELRYGVDLAREAALLVETYGHLVDGAA